MMMSKYEIERIEHMLKNKAQRCAYCGRKFTAFDLKTIDHITPKAHGLDESGINKVVCCKHCNVQKGSMKLAEFRKSVNKHKILEYLNDFGTWQLPTGEHYANAIRKRFRITNLHKECNNDSTANNSSN